MFTSSDIKSILFGDPRYLVRITELVEYLRTILGDSETRVAELRMTLSCRRSVLFVYVNSLRLRSGDKRGALILIFFVNDLGTLETLLYRLKIFLVVCEGLTGI